MSLTLKNLAAVALTGSPVELVAAPTGSKRVLINSIRLTNTGGTSRKVSIIIRNSPSTDYYVAKDVSVPDNTTAMSGASIELGGDVTLEVNYSLRGVADGTGVDCVISGAEQS
jgi:hypothetical protein